MTDCDHGKSQWVRLYVDVLVLGPYLVWLAARPGRLTQGQKLALTGIGIATVVYNWNNYVRIKAKS